MKPQLNTSALWDEEYHEEYKIKRKQKNRIQQKNRYQTE